MAVYSPNDCVVRLPTSRFTYALDGSVCHCSGRRAIDIDVAPIVKLTEHTTRSVQASGSGGGSKDAGMKLVVENSSKHDKDDNDDCSWLK
jgi:hypothetical protein